MTGVVIVNYKSDELTKRFVREEVRKIGIPHKTVVVDVGGTLDEFPGVKLVRADNRGFAHACNVGAQSLRGEVSHFLFTNNDVTLTSPNVVEALMDTFLHNPDAGAVGPVIMGPDGHRQGPDQYMGMWKRLVWMYLSTPFLSKRRKRELFHIYECDSAGAGIYHFLSAAFMMVDADSFFRAGMFDENTFLYAEENILSDRMNRIGKYFYFNPSVSVFHERGATVRKYYARRHEAIMKMQSLVYYYRNYRGYSRISCYFATLIHRMILLVK